MTERVAEQVRRVLRERPDATVRFTAAITPDSHHYSMSSGRPELFLNPVHEQLVAEIRAQQATVDGEENGGDGGI